MNENIGCISLKLLEITIGEQGMSWFKADIEARTAEVSEHWGPSDPRTGI